MVKPRRTTTENNRKVTDFFQQSSQASSFSPLPSSAPALSTGHTTAKQTPEPRKTTLSQTQPQTQTQTSLKKTTRVMPSQSRTTKKENAPPPREVIYISSSSDAATRISISSTSVRSVNSGVVEVIPPAKQKRQHMQIMGIASSSPLPSQKRRSSRSQLPRTQGTANATPRPRRQAPRKRKKPDGVQSDDGDVIDVDTMEEVIYVRTKPAEINLVTPEPSVRPRPSVSRKRTCLNAKQPPDTSSDVVPSSQSDEQELTIPKKTQKDLNEIKESVREWQLSSSQSNVPPESSDPLDFESNFDDAGMDVELEYPTDSPSTPAAPDRPETPVSAKATPETSPLTTLRKESRTQTPSNSPTPRKTSASAALESVRIPSGSKSPSMFISSSSSSTKVGDVPIYTLSPKQAISLRSSPIRKLTMTGSPGSPSPANNSETDMAVDVPVLTEKEKTNAIVERIKAEARAKAMAMPDEDSMVLASLDDSDSDLGSPTNLLQLAKNKPEGEASKRASSTDADPFDDGTESPLTDVDDLENQLLRRRSTRQQSRRSSSLTSSSATSTRTRKAPSMLPTVLTSTACAAPKKKPVDPLSKLLKEKARQERFAEIRKNPEIEFDDANLSDAAEEGSSDGRLGSPSKLRRQPSDEGDIEKVVGEVDRRKLFGEEDTHTLGKIFESDRRDKGKGKAQITELGVPFWETCLEGAMEVDVTLPDPPCIKDPSFALLKEFVDAKDIDSITIILQSGVLTTRDTGFMEWLFEVAVCSVATLAVAARTLLGHICEVRLNDDRCLVISLSPVLKSISRFRARQDTLEALQLQIPAYPNLSFTVAQRSEALWRLSELIRLLASNTMLDKDDVPSYFALLLAIGMDPKSDFNLKSSIKRSLNTLISGYCGDFSDTRGDMEKGVCSKVLALTPGLSPANKEYLLSFIDGDSPIVRRIGQWIAFAILTADYGMRLAKEFAAGPPPLSDIIALLNPRLDSKVRSDLFNVSRNSEHFDTIDYSALTHHVGVLGRVLMNIPQYMQIEKQEKERKSEGFSKSNNEVSKLQIIKDQLDHLGNNITDTRAAHLDRSQAKAVILQLAVRIHYQRRAGIQSTQKPRIENFFSRKVT